MVQIIKLEPKKAERIIYRPTSADILPFRPKEAKLETSGLITAKTSSEDKLTLETKNSLCDLIEESWPGCRDLTD
ncbi:MAG: hypothetical protein ACJAVO_001304 [Parvibaculaceae bacterium]|jgi:hypothetical protein|tara:strand:+ start:858 stop:1082 length:225 start_codon:yes stop_codon:yes gene_type:complete